MQNLILHSYRRCPFAIRVRMVLELKSIKYTLIEEKLSQPSEQLLKINAQGSVPVLVHNGHVITESAIITEYLDEIFPQLLLAPANPLQRAQMRLWTHWCNTDFKVDLDRYKYKWDSLSQEQQSILSDKLHAHLQKLESVLAKQAFILGDTLSLADIHVFPFYRQLQKAKLDFSTTYNYPATNAWLERIVKMPSFERVMAK
jgi:glutathione S-transferase